MNTIFLLSSQVNSNETIITVDVDKLISSLYALAILFVALLIFTIVLCLQYRKLKHLKSEQSENEFIKSLSKEERNVINLYNRLDDTDKQSIVDTLKTLNSKD